MAGPRGLAPGGGRPLPCGSVSLGARACRTPPAGSAVFGLEARRQAAWPAPRAGTALAPEEAAVAGRGAFAWPCARKAAEPEGLWSCNQSMLAATEGKEWSFIGKVALLDKQAVRSVGRAIDLLNQHILHCSEGICAVYSAKFRAYYLIYRRDKRSVALAILKQIIESIQGRASVPRLAPMEQQSVSALATSPASPCAADDITNLEPLRTAAGELSERSHLSPVTSECQVSPLSASTFASASALSGCPSPDSLSSSTTAAPPTACPSPSGRSLLRWPWPGAVPTPAALHAAVAALAVEEPVPGVASTSMPDTPSSSVKESKASIVADSAADELLHAPESARAEAMPRTSSLSVLSTSAPALGTSSPSTALRQGNSLSAVLTSGTPWASMPLPCRLSPTPSDRKASGVLDARVGGGAGGGSISAKQSRTCRAVSPQRENCSRVERIMGEWFAIR